MRTFTQKPKATKQTKSTKPGRALSGQSLIWDSILYLQRTIGNQAVQRLLQSKTEDIEVSSVSNTIQRQVETDEKTEPATPIENTPQLSTLTQELKHQAAMVRAIFNDQGSPVLPRRVTVVGESWCNPNTGKPEWKINKKKIPKCMWACGELHEKTHAKFNRWPCERVWNEIARAEFWIRVTKKYIKQNKKADIERAYKEALRATAEVQKVVKWYIMYHQQTCLYNEIMAYEAGIKLCDTAKVRSDCVKTGETAKYNSAMAAWRKFRLKPPSCPVIKRKP